MRINKTISKPRICVVGPGVVGLATGKAFLAKGFDVSFLGRTPEKVENLRKQGYSAYTKDDLINGNYDFDITMFTVPTPTVDGKVDLSAINAASTDLGKRLKFIKKYHLAVVKSTVPPGTSEKIVIRNLEKHSGKKAGVDFGVCMNPEYLREETAYEDSINMWLILIGQYDERSGDLLEQVYKYFKTPMHRTSLREAEMQKYVHNLYNAAKISFFNEMRQVAAHLGADADKIFKLTAISAEGIWNPNYGIKNKGPFSGSCLPKDTQAFFDWAKKQKVNMQLLKSVIDVNNEYREKLGIAKQTKIGASL